MAKRYENMNDYNEELEGKKKKRMTLNPFENMFNKDGKGIEKDELFSYVSEHGNLPRKTFSMGEAVSKRYYIEARKIV